MALNLLPDRRWGVSPSVGIAAGTLGTPSLHEGIAWVREAGFTGIEIDASARPGALHAPAVSREDRTRLRAELADLSGLALVAPHKDTFDVSLVSPSAAIRRASVAEIWAVCRLAEALGGAVVSVRSGWAPSGVDRRRQRELLLECLTTLDRVAGDHNATIGVENADYFADADALGELEALPLRHVGITLDAERLIENRGEPVETLVRRFGRRIVHLRLPGPEGGDPSDPADVVAALEANRYVGMTCLVPGRGFVSPEQARETKARWDRAVADARGSR